MLYALPRKIAGCKYTDNFRN